MMLEAPIIHTIHIQQAFSSLINSPYISPRASDDGALKWRLILPLI